MVVAALISEAVGTFFLMLAVQLAGGSEFTPLAVGAVLTSMVYMGGHVSKAHYNPAITLAFWIRSTIATPLAVRYVAVQLLAAGAAVLTAAAIRSNDAASPLVPQAQWPAALLAEVIFTFALALVILNVALARNLAGNSFYGIAIGLTVAGAAYCVGPVSGAALNPAVGLGGALVALLLKGTGNPLSLIYLVGPCLGATFAALLFPWQTGERAA